MSSVLRKYASFTAHEKPTTGDMKMSFVNDDHLGWLKCNGRTVTKTEFGILFNVIGYTFGGSGNNFILPDVSGVVPGIVNNVHPIGSQVGSEVHTLTLNEIPQHNHDFSGSHAAPANGYTDVSGAHIHGITDPGHAHQYLGVDSQNAASGLDNVAENSPRPSETTSAATTSISINTAGAHSHRIASNGGGAAHNNMQPTYFVGNMFIYSGDPPAGVWPLTIQAGGYPRIY